MDNTKAKANLAFSKLKATIAEHETAMQELKAKFGEAAADILAKLETQHQGMIQLMQDAESIFQPSLKWRGKGLFFN
jgi:hypothetical protein